jgi:hypothetical protein
MSAPWEDGKAERWLGLMVVAFNLFFACTQKPSSSATFLPIYMRPGARFRSPASLGASMAPLHFSRGGKARAVLSIARLSLPRMTLFWQKVASRAKMMCTTVCHASDLNMQCNAWQRSWSLIRIQLYPCRASCAWESMPPWLLSSRRHLCFCSCRPAYLVTAKEEGGKESVLGHATTVSLSPDDEAKFR